MKVLKRLFSSIILVFILFSASFSQTNSIVRKIAFIDKSELLSSSSEINRVKTAYKILDFSGCFPIYGNQIFKIVKDLRNSLLTEEDRTQKQNELKEILKLQREDYLRKEKVILQPIVNEISASIKKIEIDNNIKIFDYDEFTENNGLVFVDPDLNITTKFIEYFNNFNDKSGELILTIPDSKIAILNSETLYRIKNVEEDSKRYNLLVGKKSEELSDSEIKFADNFLKLISRISEEIKQFAYDKKFTLIFKSKDGFPPEIKDLESIEITEDFIQYFNNKYP